MATPVVGSAANLTATGNVGAANRDKAMLGFYVNSTTSGTIVFRVGGSSGTVVNGTATPAVGWHNFPLSAPGGLHATIGGTLDVTILFIDGAS